jgi:nucleotide-binding universal stress UspA family protein
MSRIDAPAAVYSHLLVTTDYSSSAEPALRAAAELARRMSARVTVLNVVDLGALGDSQSLRESLLRLEHEFRAEATPRLEALCRKVFEGVPFEVAVIEGMGASVATARYVREHSVDLVVIATHGLTGFKRFVLGSVSERVVQGSPCDVLVVPSNLGSKGPIVMPIQRILVPTDFSPSASQAIERAVDLAKLTNAEIHLLHAYEIPVGVGVPGVPLAIPPEFFDQVRDASQHQLDEVAKRVAARGLKVQSHLTCDTPARAILDASEQIHVDLIVMGTRGRTGMKHVLLGSVAERTVRLSTCPVVTVKSTNE